MKLNQLQINARHLRIVRPDGNCFYRAYALRLIEICRQSPELALSIKERLSEAMKTSIMAVYGSGAIDEFYEAFIETLDSQEDVYKLDTSTDLYIVTFMRCLTSAYLQSHSDEYLPFLDGNFSSVADFCRKNVDPMHRECDQLQITALTSQVGVAVEIHYFDRSARETANVIRIPSADSSTVITLVYKPGHYDILYT